MGYSPASVDGLPKPKFWEGTKVPRAAYATYVCGKDAFILGAPLKFGAAEKKKMKKLTIKQQIKKLEADRDFYIAECARKRTQLSEQNRLLDRARIEGNELIDKYNKLAGKLNAIRSLVTNND